MLHYTRVARRPEPTWPRASRRPGTAPARCDGAGRRGNAQRASVRGKQGVSVPAPGAVTGSPPAGSGADSGELASATG